MTGTIVMKYVQFQKLAIKQFPPIQSKASYARISGLDGLRLIAVSIVLARHFEISTLVPGGLGVTIFFFISGFLITRLLLAEEDETNRIDLGAFFVRRLIRLLPPLLLMGIVMIPLLIMLLPERFDLTSTIFNFAYLGNFYGIYEHFSGAEVPHLAFGALWSLAVEEHFYLLLPLLLVLLRSHRARIVAVFLFAAVMPVLLRLAVYVALPAELADSVNYSFTFTRIDSIGWGVLLAMCLHANWIRLRLIGRYDWPVLIVGGGGMLLATIHWSEAYVVAWRYTPQTLFIGLSVIAIMFGKNMSLLRFLLELPPVSLLGRASYEIYLWHLPIYYLAERYISNGSAATAMALVVTLLASVSAYHVTTTLGYDLRKRFGSRSQS
jgi:peptidoglycan/LPS O-acetylase OafA/YrhL